MHCCKLANFQQREGKINIVAFLILSLCTFKRDSEGGKYGLKLDIKSDFDNFQKNY